MSKRESAKIRWVVFFACLCLSSIVVSAQTAGADTAFVRLSKQKAYALYTNAIADQANLFNGSEFVERYDYASPKGFPFYGSDDWIDGTITYDSGVYTNVGLMYDLVNDKLVLDMPYSHFKLELVSEKIKSFTLEGHTFVRVVTFKNDSSFRSGFYEALYIGKVKAYARRFKERREAAHTTGIEVDYQSRNAWYIERNGIYHRVRSRASVLSVFADRKKELKKKIRAVSPPVDFRKHRDAAIAVVTRLYDESEK